MRTPILQSACQINSTTPKTQRPKLQPASKINQALQKDEIQSESKDPRRQKRGIRQGGGPEGESFQKDRSQRECPHRESTRNFENKRASRQESEHGSKSQTHQVIRTYRALCHPLYGNCDMRTRRQADPGVQTCERGVKTQVRQAGTSVVYTNLNTRGRGKGQGYQVTREASAMHNR